MTDDDLDPIPSFTATRDDPLGDVPPRAAATSKKGKSQSSAPASGGGAGFFARLFITIALVIAGVACAWAWQLQEELRQANYEASQYAQRISDLEDRLSDTDEGMSQNAAVQAAKIRELDSEVRKLWDNVWKKAGKRLDTLEATSKRQAGKVSANEQAVAKSGKDLSLVKEDVARLASLSADLERLMRTAGNSQTEIERLADAVNAANLEVSKLNKRVGSNEEWLESVNAFRRQMNAALADLQNRLNAMQAGG